MTIYVIETPHQGAPICWVADDEQMFIGLADSGTKREPLPEDATYNEAAIYLAEGLRSLAMYESTDQAADYFLRASLGSRRWGPINEGWASILPEVAALGRQLQYRVGEITDHATRLRVLGIIWGEARVSEREISGEAYEVIRDAAGTMPETKIAEALGVDRMTVRRALGKR
jgi:hypothetical protein